MISSGDGRLAGAGVVSERFVHVAAPAKLNLTLEIVGRRADGYHLLESVMQSIDIADVVTVTAAAPDDIATEGDVANGGGGPNGMAVPEGEGNLAARATAAFRAAAAETLGSEKAAALPPLRIRIDKRIPVAAGLGGGSADAAAALVAANELWGLHWSRERLAEIGVTVGADVPFCIYGGTATARGIGERLTPVSGVDTARWAGVVLNPGFAVSTEAVYRAYSETVGSDAGSEPGRAAAMAKALQRGDVRAAGGLLYNALDPVTTKLHPEVGELRRRALRAGAMGAVMCGSGPSVFALARDAEHAAVLGARLAQAAAYVGVCRFTARGSRPVATEGAS